MSSSLKVLSAAGLLSVCVLGATGVAKAQGRYLPLPAPPPFPPHPRPMPLPPLDTPFGPHPHATIYLPPMPPRPVPPPPPTTPPPRPVTDYLPHGYSR